MVRALRLVHAAIRNDLAVCQELAADASAGVSTVQVRARVAALRTTGTLWQLRTTCLHTCRFVHEHHGHEDHLLFPLLRRASPTMAPVLDRLEADHREVSRLLEETEDAVGGLDGDDPSRARARLIRALRSLGGTLIAHLELEEEAISPTLLGWTAWPP